MPLFDTLKQNKRAGSNSDGQLVAASSKRGIKKYASSVKSSGGASMRSLAQSVVSFYSVMTGSGPRVPKRRRADFSKLGVPEWYEENPPPPPFMPGTAAASPAPMFTGGTASTLYMSNEEDKPWLGLVLYSHVRPESTLPLYHNAAKVTGEVRVAIDSPMNIGSIDVWVVITAASSLDTFNLPLKSMTVNLWSRKKGDPRSSTGGLFKGKFPAGTFVFPFELPELPEDTLVKHPDDTKRRNQARVPLPPTYFVSNLIHFWGKVKYTAGVNVVRDGLGDINEEFDVEMQYLPLAKPLPRIKTSFPYLPTHEDWPFNRELLGGWTLTPFGGRGRLGQEFVEVEGMVIIPLSSATPHADYTPFKLGVQEPAVYTAGQLLEFSLLLWSHSPLALEALGQPGAIEVGFYKADIFAANVLDPRTSSRRNRYFNKLAVGRTWLADDGRPAAGAPVPTVRKVVIPAHGRAQKPPAPPAGSGSTQHHAKGAPSAHPLEMLTEEEDDNATLTGSTAALSLGEESKGGEEQDGGVDVQRAPSPAPSLEDLDAEDGAHAEDHFVRLDGEVRVPVCSHPSFRYTNMGREYVLYLLIKHPQYTQLSPKEAGLIVETPILYVLDRFAHLPPQADGPQDLAALPVTGTVIPVGPDSVRAPLSVGAYTEDRRPTNKFKRLGAN
ncbi:hypothetical protein C8R46DRAFT_1207493 [Mycena filopes]|nr:hypothetical protein C8R46DRAFT_1207493 [Mycena filopes]